MDDRGNIVIRKYAVYTIILFISAIVASVLSFVLIILLSAGFKSFENLELPFFAGIAISPFFYFSWIAVLTLWMVVFLVKINHLKDKAHDTVKCDSGYSADGRTFQGTGLSIRFLWANRNSLFSIIGSLIALFWMGTILDSSAGILKAGALPEWNAELPLVSRAVRNIMPANEIMKIFMFFLWMMMPLGAAWSSSGERDPLIFRIRMLRLYIFVWAAAAIVSGIVSIGCLWSFLSFSGIDALLGEVLSISFLVLFLSFVLFAAIRQIRNASASRARSALRNRR